MTEQIAIVVPQEQSRWLSPVASIEQALARYALMHEYATRVLKTGHHYGVVPGTDKPTLLKPGAETLCSLFGLAPTFNSLERILDVTGAEHEGEPFIYFQYCCALWSGNIRIAEGIGSCNSWEKKYRYRNADLKCPACGKTTIIKGKAEYGGGWVCFTKKGGCGAKFADTAPAIVDQPRGQVKNPDISDIINTLDKMAQKRALVAATLIATNASDYFTQDLEDVADYSNVVDAQVQEVTTQAQKPAPTPAPEAPPATGSVEPWTLDSDGHPYDEMDNKALSYHLTGLVNRKGDAVKPGDPEKISYLKKLLAARNSQAK